MTENELYQEFKKEYDKQLCYDLSCEARDCCECQIFLDEFEGYKNERCKGSV